MTRTGSRRGSNALRSSSAGDQDHWLAWRQEAEQLGAPAAGETELEAMLAVLGRLLPTEGLAVTSHEDAPHVLPAWGNLPAAWRGDVSGGPAERAPEGDWLARPLSSEGTAYGSLWITRGAWEQDPERVQYLDATADLMGAALRNRAILQQERDQRALAESLQRLSARLATSLEMEEVLSIVLDELARLVPYDSATVMLLEDGALRLHAQRGFDWGAGHGVLNTVAFDPQTTPGTLEVLTSDRPIILADVRTVPGWIWLPGSSHIRGWMGVPLRVQGRPIGMFSVDNAQPDFFTPRHVALTAALAPQAAIAIERARLFQELRAAETQLRGLSARVMEAQELERQRIGRELHDHAGQALLALRAELQILARQLPDDAGAAQAQIAKIDEVVRATARDLRLLSHELHAHLLEEFGLSPALQQQAQDFAARFGINVDFSIQGNGSRRHPRIVELAGLRIAQEALTNIARHAQAQRAWVRLIDLPDRLQVIVQDDGVGFDLEACSQAGCYGLIGMRERATAANGSLYIWTHADEGTQIVAEFPLTGGTHEGAYEKRE
jgi:signal transduction histidine kinase